MTTLWGQTFTRAELLAHVGRLDQIAGVRLVTLDNGVERGTRVLEFRTGTGFGFDVLVDRAMDIGRAEYQGKALGWQSAAGFPGPWAYEPEGLGWLRGFGGGLLTTCGLENIGSAGEDTGAPYAYPARKTMTFGLHGRISYRPARLTGYGERWDGDTCTLWAEGEIIQAAPFSEQLVLHRRIEAVVGESRLRVHDRVENIGPALTPHMLLYHVNFGFPALANGSELLVRAGNPRSHSDRSLDTYRQFHGPDGVFVEHVIAHDVEPEADGAVPAAVVNRALGFGGYQISNHKQLPCQAIWRMLGQGTYVVGVEPCTSWGGHQRLRETGELIELAAGESREYDLELGALTDGAAIDAFAARVG